MCSVRRKKRNVLVLVLVPERSQAEGSQVAVNQVPNRHKRSLTGVRNIT